MTPADETGTTDQNTAASQDTTAAQTTTQAGSADQAAASEKAPETAAAPADKEGFVDGLKQQLETGVKAGEAEAQKVEGEVKKEAATAETQATGVFGELEAEVKTLLKDCKNVIERLLHPAHKDQAAPTLAKLNSTIAKLSS